MIRKKARMPALTTSIQRSTGSLSQSNKARKRKDSIYKKKIVMTNKQIQQNCRIQNQQIKISCIYNSIKKNKMLNKPNQGGETHTLKTTKHC